ncbi:MAG: YidC/Oxa1 family membrane protein insertase [Patescibacteria group bacterium]|nr:YidC/Oxa1 family membrane protein insertase [Patescibacteria group bacterium]
MENIFNSFFITPIVAIFLSFYYYFEDAGWVIIITAIFLKIILLPLDYFSYLEEEKIKKVSQKINELTKDIKDFLKRSEIMSKIYKEENVSPFKNLLIQLISLPILIAFFLAIPKFLESIDNFYFLNLINLKIPNIFLASISFIFQIIFIFYFTQPEQKKIALFFSAVLAPIFLILPAGLLLYILITLFFALLERKLIFSQKVQFGIKAIKKNNTQRS